MRDGLGRVQSVAVLGGTSDIGLAIAEELVGRGATRVALAARDTSAAQSRGDALRTLGAAVDVVSLDAADTGSHDALVGALFEHDVDVVVLAAGILGDAAAMETDADAAADLLRVNVVGAASLALRCAARLAVQGHGALVVLSSVAGERVRRSNFVYGASKSAIDGIGQGLGEALRGSGARVLVVRPGFVHTKMTAGMQAPPLSVDASAVARAVVRGLEHGSEVVWVPPALRLVMSALRHLPRWAFRRLNV